jgi:hypothetical protein
MEKDYQNKIEEQNNFGENQQNIKGDEQMKRAYRAASKMSSKIIEETDPEGFKFLKDVKNSDIIITRGEYDHGQVIFELTGIPYSLINPEEIANIELREDQIIFINCPGRIPTRGLDRIKSFVQNGGMLVTTDWALLHVLEKIYPTVVQYNSRSTADDVVRVVFEKIDDTFLKGLLDPKDEPIWWLEGSSYPIKILDKGKVKVLVSSKEMKEKYGEDPIVITFEEGKGKIYHMTSHFYLQRTETRSKRHEQKGSNYASMKGVSKSAFSKEELQDLEGTNVAQMESAYTSARTLSNMVMEQKKRVESRKQEKSNK